MQYEQLLAHITPAIYERFKQAIELGKWPDGRVLTAVQKQSCMAAVLHYQQLNLPEKEQTGYIATACPSHSSSQITNDDQSQTLKITE